MLHRFAATPDQARGHLPTSLQNTLSLLRNSGVSFLSLDDAVEEYIQAGNSALPRRSPSVAFTVDDGYLDFMEVGLPVFEQFGCPVTCFVVPDVVDGKSWFWWDRLDFVLRRLPNDSMRLAVEGESFEVRRSSEEYSWRRPIVDMLKSRSESFRQQFLLELEERSNVTLPATVPDEYRVMSWDAIRACEKRGVRFGAHSMSHPVLSQVSDHVAANEILCSVQRLRQELSNPSTVFCYPYGLSTDFGSREVRILRESGVRYAVSALPGVVTPTIRRFDPANESAWRIPRFAFDGRPGMALRQLLFS